MSSKLRRYEILLPTRFNDGRKVPHKLIASTLNGIVAQFGAVSYQRRAVEGRWLDQETLYRDTLSRIFVDVADDEISREWMNSLKERLKSDFEQLEIWMVSYIIERN